MQLSGNYLPILSGVSSYSPNKEAAEYGRPSPDRNLDTEQKNRQQTVEYVFKGELLDEITSEQQKRQQYSQAIDPANQSAISSYVDTATLSEQQGSLVDIFI